MRDEKDSGTFEMLPAKRGRPCLDAEHGPLSAAEKQRRYRTGKHADVMLLRSAAAREPAFVRDQSDADILAAIKADLVFARRASAPAKKRIAALVAELSRRYPISKGAK